jgi:hypothetical protein
MRLTSTQRWTGTAVTIRYEIELWAGRWFVRDKRANARHGPYASCQDAHDVLREIGTILSQADLHIRRLLGESSNGP